MDSPGLDDSELLRRARVDANAFGVFYRRHARAVYRSLLSDCGDPDLALDLTAETFARALQSLGRFRGLHVASGRAWIFAIANSLRLQYQRELRTEDRARRRLGILEATRTHPDDDSVVARVDAAASGARLAHVLHGLPESQQLSTLRDDRLVARAQAAAVSGPFGVRPRDRRSGRAWLIPGHRVAGYTTPGGSFCFAFVGLTGGCLHAGRLTAAVPVDLTTDYGPNTFRVYGLAMDGVTAISLQARGATRLALMGRNAFYLEDSALGGTRGFAGTLLVRMRDGSTRRMPLHVGALEMPKFLPRLPGVMPVGDTAA